MSAPQMVTIDQSKQRMKVLEMVAPNRSAGARFMMGLATRASRLVRTTAAVYYARASSYELFILGIFHSVFSDHG